MSDDFIGSGLRAGVNARIGTHMENDGIREPVDDLERAPKDGQPPVPGAQWDELHQRWERWDESSQSWLEVLDATTSTEITEEENPLPAVLARANLVVDDLDAHAVPIDEHRRPEPGDARRGAQWNEVAGRWERWDPAADAWVEATAANEPPGD